MPSKEKKVFFRKNLVGGFNKTDVIEFISAHSRQQNSEKDSLSLELGRKTKELAEQSARLAALEEEKTALSAELDRRDAQIAEQNELIAARDSELAEIKSAAFASALPSGEVPDGFAAHAEPECDQLRAELAAERQARVAAEQRLDSVMSGLRSITGDGDGGGADLESDRRIEELNERLSELSLQLSEADSENRALAETVESLNEYKSKVMGTIKTLFGNPDEKDSDGTVFVPADFPAPPSVPEVSEAPDGKLMDENFGYIYEDSAEDESGEEE